MQILIHNKIECNRVADFFNFNQIDHQRIDFYTNLDTDPIVLLPNDVEKTLCVLDADTFCELLSAEISVKNLLDYCKKNVLWIYQKYDIYFSLQKMEDKINFVDGKTRKNSIVFFCEFEFQNHNHSMNQYKNIHIVNHPVNADFYFPRVSGAYLTKEQNSKDFLLTTTLRNNRQHRNILKAEFDKKPHLYKKGFVKFGSLASRNNGDKSPTDWIGELGHSHNWWAGHMSMDLYRNAYFEIVPETTFEDIHMVSEKITKSICSKTPFLCLSTPGYLKFLQSLGYKTFSHLIDESYDTIDDVSERTKKLVETAEHIILNGSADFYQQSIDVIEHNYNVLASLVGQKEHLYDLMFQKELDKIG